MEPLLHLFAARLVMNEDRNQAMEFAKADMILYGQTQIAIGKQLRQIQDMQSTQEAEPEAVQHEQSATTTPETTTQPEIAQPTTPEVSATNLVDSDARMRLMEVLRPYGLAGQNILLAFDKAQK